MNRIIKFRAWDSYNKKMIDLGELESISMRKTAGHDDDFANYELMQYTGLLDKNGKEIYEGDLVKLFDRNIFVQVKYDEFSASFRLWAEKWQDSEPWFSLEVIGNIYENKELIP